MQNYDSYIKKAQKLNRTKELAEEIEKNIRSIKKISIICDDYPQLTVATAYNIEEGMTSLMRRIVWDMDRKIKAEFEKCLNDSEESEADDEE